MQKDNHNTLLQLLSEAQNHPVACICLSNGFEDPYGQYEILAGFGVVTEYHTPEELDKNDVMKLGFCSYDLKNKLEPLISRHPQAVPVPDCYFFEPEQYFKLKRNSNQAETNMQLPEPVSFSQPRMASEFTCGTPKELYLNNVDSIKECIRNGDFYEMNYCLQFECNTCLNPYSLFAELNQTAPAPFAVFFKYFDQFLLCSSPERFLAKRKDVLTAQPIKGTRKRHADETQDWQIKIALADSEKDRAENIMIVDLLRNDLSRVCEPGSVTVPELCKVYSFSHVHQMISTVTGKLQANKGFSDIIKATFPMGSMTGAPKIQVMKDVERFENFSRGWYSGSVGYWENGDFDFNVIIRSIQMDTARETMYYHVGGAITSDSEPEDEFNECMEKAAGLLQTLQNQADSNL